MYIEGSGTGTENEKAGMRNFGADTGNVRPRTERDRTDIENDRIDAGNRSPGYSFHGGDVYRHSVEYDFSVNVNPLGMPPQVIKRLGDTVESWHRYPDPYCQELRTALSDYCNVPSDLIVCGNGAADLLDRLIRVWRPERALIPVPTFTEYERLLSQEGRNLHFFYLKEEENFVPQVDKLIRALERTQSGRQEKLKNQQWIGKTENWEEQGRMMVILCNPNNPTGQAIPAKEVVRLAKACRRTRSLLVLDECFCEFLEKEDEYSFMEQIGNYPEVVILRAFTKFFAMAGLRLGYAVCGDRELAKCLQERGQPWSVSIPAQEGGIAALKAVEETSIETGYVKAAAENAGKVICGKEDGCGKITGPVKEAISGKENRYGKAAAEDLGKKEFMKEAGCRQRTLSLLATEREFLRRELTSLGFTVYPSQVNFLLFRDDPREEDGDLWEACLRRRILIRDCRDFRGLPGRLLRGDQDQGDSKTACNYQDQEKAAAPGDKPEDKKEDKSGDKKGEKPGDRRPSLWYRVCVGLPEANRHLIQVLKEICEERCQ